MLLLIWNYVQYISIYFKYQNDSGANLLFQWKRKGPYDFQIFQFMKI